MKNIIFFDGSCGFCNRTVLFFARNDIDNQFLFMSNESEEGKDILKKEKSTSLSQDTIILLKNHMIYTKSQAIKEILLKLGGFKTLGIVMSLFPRLLSDFVYDLVSKYRRKIISKQNCQIPEQHIRDKFILK